MDKEFAGLTAIITGAGSGIGLELHRRQRVPAPVCLRTWAHAGRAIAGRGE